MTDFGRNFLEILVLISNIAFVLVLISLAIPKWRSGVWTWIQNNATWMAFIVALAATAGSLFYSKVLGWEPCELCWYQRIALYPLLFIFWLAWIRKDIRIWRYSIILSVLGGLIALYHYFLQVGIVPNIVGCDAVGVSVSCETLHSLAFGYITIPWMAVSAALIITALCIALRAKEKRL